MKSSSAASAQWRSSKSSTTGPVSAIRSKKSRQAEMEILPVGRNAVGQPEDMLEARLHPLAFGGVGHMLLDRRVQLRERLVRRIVLRDAGAHPHHLGERPVRDAVAVGEAAAAVPPDVLHEAVDVLLELPGQARLADPGHADHGDEARPPVVPGRVEQVLDEPELAVAPDERRLEPGRAPLAAPRPDHSRRTPELDRLRLALHLVRAGVLVDDRRLRGPLGRLADEDGARLRRALHPRRGVDEVAGDHPLALRAERDRCLPGEHTGSRAQIGRADLLPSAETPETRSSAARTARSASSSCATGAPQTAMTASPMNFSTVPP